MYYTCSRGPGVEYYLTLFLSRVVIYIRIRIHTYIYRIIAGPLFMFVSISVFLARYLAYWSTRYKNRTLLYNLTLCYYWNTRRFFFRLFFAETLKYFSRDRSGDGGRPEQNAFQWSIYRRLKSVKKIYECLCVFVYAYLRTSFDWNLLLTRYPAAFFSNNDAYNRGCNEHRRRQWEKLMV